MTILALLSVAIIVGHYVRTKSKAELVCHFYPPQERHYFRFVLFFSSGSAPFPAAILLLLWMEGEGRGNRVWNAEESRNMYIPYSQVQTTKTICLSSSNLSYSVTQTLVLQDAFEWKFTTRSEQCLASSFETGFSLDPTVSNDHITPSKHR